jgi:TorA maturation chaperone TorD
MVRQVAGQGALYRLLSVALQWPAECFGTVVSDALDNARADMGRDEELSLLEKAFRQLIHLPLEKAQAEYTSLFINGYPTTPCPLYESAYCDGGSLLGQSAEDVANIYARWGLASATQFPDHISVELEFLHDLWRVRDLSTAADRDALDASIAAFWTDHLGRWMGRFAADLETHAQSAFYRAVAALLRSCAEEERKNPTHLGGTQ